MHMVSRKDLNSAELESMRISKNPPTVVTVNGEVLTKEEATVYVRELDLFVTVKLLEETAAVLSLGKLCVDHGYSSIGPVVRNHISSKNGRKIDCNSANYVSFVVLLVFRQALQAHLHILLLHLHRRKPHLPRSIQHQQEVRV